MNCRVDECIFTFILVFANTVKLIGNRVLYTKKFYEKLLVVFKKINMKNIMVD